MLCVFVLLRLLLPHNVARQFQPPNLRSGLGKSFYIFSHSVPAVDWGEGVGMQHMNHLRLCVTPLSKWRNDSLLRRPPQKAFEKREKLWKMLKRKISQNMRIAFLSKCDGGPKRKTRPTVSLQKRPIGSQQQAQSAVEAGQAVCSAGLMCHCAALVRGAACD